MESNVSPKVQSTAGNNLTNRDVEQLLETVLGRPRQSLRDLHTELVLADRQRSLLRQLATRNDDDIYGIEEVELMLDAVDEYADGALRVGSGSARTDEELSPPPLTVREMRKLVALAALARGMLPGDLLERVDEALCNEQLRLRKSFLTAVLRRDED
jgi:hypothetical protein